MEFMQQITEDPLIASDQDNSGIKANKKRYRKISVVNRVVWVWKFTLLFIKLARCSGFGGRKYNLTPKTDSY